MKPNYCLPVIKTDMSEVLAAVTSSLDSYRYFEVWLDYVTQIDEDDLSQLLEMLGDRLIIVFRRKELERPVMDPSLRTRLLGKLSGTPALVDLDVTTQQAELDHIKAAGLEVNLIASYHNYDETPDTLQLRRIIDTMGAYRPAIYKLSTLCRTESDAVELLQILLELRGKDVRAIVSGMGEYGAVTRIFGTLWGSEMVFAPLNASDQSAPGQLTRQQLEVIFKELAR